MSFSEKVTAENRKEEETFTAKTKNEEKNPRGFVGIVTDTLIAKEDTEVELPGGEMVSLLEGESFEYPESHNVVVEDCSTLIACLMKGESGQEGIQYWESGSGEDTWDDDNPPAPSKTDSSLVNPTHRKIINASDISFITDENEETNSFTNRLKISIQYGTDEANGDLREFGLFGGNASSSLGSGLMINHKTHAHIRKTSALEMERTLRISF